MEHRQLPAKSQKETAEGLHLLYPFKQDTSGLRLEVPAGNQTHTEGLPHQITSRLLRYLSLSRKSAWGGLVKDSHL